jgi:hypothetical protein
MIGRRPSSSSSVRMLTVGRPPPAPSSAQRLVSTLVTTRCGSPPSSGRLGSSSSVPRRSNAYLRGLSASLFLGGGTSEEEVASPKASPDRRKSPGRRRVERVGLLRLDGLVSHHQLHLRRGSAFRQVTIWGACRIRSLYGTHFDGPLQKLSLCNTRKGAVADEPPPVGRPVGSAGVDVTSGQANSGRGSGRSVHNLDG